MEIIISIVLVILALYLSYKIIAFIFRFMHNIIRAINLGLVVFLLITLFTGQWLFSVILFFVIGILELLRTPLIKPIIVAMLSRMGAGTAEQIAQRARKSIDDTKDILKDLAKAGKIEQIILQNGQVLYKVMGQDISICDNFVRNEINLD